MMQGPSMFRQEALEHLASPEQLDRVMRVTNPKGWLALATAGAILAGLTAWSILGTIPTRVTGQGILMAPDGVEVVVAEMGAVVEDVLVSAGQDVTVGQVVARAVDDENREVTIRSTVAGRVTEMRLGTGQRVSKGNQVLSAVDPNKPLVGYTFFPLESGAAQLRTGQRGKVRTVTFDADQYGSIRAHVGGISPFPVSEAEVAATVGLPAVAKFLAGQGAPIPVVLDLEQDPNTASGLKWTSKKGPPVPLSANTLFTATVTTSEQRPITIVLPFLK